MELARAMELVTAGVGSLVAEAVEVDHLQLGGARCDVGMFAGVGPAPLALVSEGEGLRAIRIGRAHGLAVVEGYLRKPYRV